MKKLVLGSPPIGEGPQLLAWIIEAVQKVDRATLEDIQSILQRDYTITGSYPQTRTLNATTATHLDLVSFIATLVDDLKGRNPTDANGTSPFEVIFSPAQPGGITADRTVTIITPDSDVTVYFGGKPTFRATNASAFAATNEITGYVEGVDTKNNFDPTSGRFTAPIAGRYLFHYSTLNQNLAAVGASQIYINGSTTGLSTRSAAALEYESVVAVLSLSAGDYVSVFRTTGTTFASASFAQFGGFLID